MNKIIYEIDASNGQKVIPSDDLFSGRTNVIDSVPKDKRMDSDVTIFVQAYNLLEKTKTCIESILKYTADVDFDLMLIDNGSTDGTFEYFKSIKYDKVRIVHLNKNISASYPTFFYDLSWFSKYVVFLGNDMIVTQNWLSNMIKAAESDDRIGMVTPVSSNVSNLQQVDLTFDSLTEMQRKAAVYNISDPSKWHERLRLITIGTLYKKECLYAIGWPINDIGFFHDFVDDDVTFRVRRAGYKTILAKDTWIHHNHDFRNMENKDPAEFQKSIETGRKNFMDKYFGVDAWDDVNNYIPEIIPKIKAPADKENCCILGVDVKCGTPILEIKNHIRSLGVYDAACCAITSEGKYFIDLQTVCGADNVFCCPPDKAFGYLPQGSFDYIIIGGCINEYPEPYAAVKSIYSLLKKGGQMFFYLKNTYDIFSLLNVIGYRSVNPPSYAYNMTVETFISDLKGMNMQPQIIGAIPNITIPAEYINEINRRSSVFVKDGWEETRLRLTTEKFAFSITK